MGSMQYLVVGMVRFIYGDYLKQLILINKILRETSSFYKILD
jgi:hypothetical protein